MLYLPDDVFHLVMHYRNRLMRRDAVRQLRKEIESNKIEVNNLTSELQDCGDEDEEEQLEEFIEDLLVYQFRIIHQMRIIHLKELPTERFLGPLPKSCVSLQCLSV